MRFDSSTKAKIKSLRLVCRGGAATWPSPYLKRPNQLESESFMNVDNAVTKPLSKLTDEECKYNNTYGSISSNTTYDSGDNHTKLNKKVFKPAYDHSSAMNYLNLIQNIQRKRKFSEISHDIRANQTRAETSKFISRRERLLSEISKNNEFPGKSSTNDSKFESLSNGSGHQANLETTHSKSLRDETESTVKRMKLMEIENSSEASQTIDLVQARYEQRQLRLTNAGSSSHHN